MEKLHDYIKELDILEADGINIRPYTLEQKENLNVQLLTEADARALSQKLANGELVIEPNAKAKEVERPMKIKFSQIEEYLLKAEQTIVNELLKDKVEGRKKKDVIKVVDLGVIETFAERVANKEWVIVEG